MREKLRAGAAAAKLAILLFAVWAGLDLVLRVDLPGASSIQHLGFRALVVPFEWLTEGDGLRLQVAGLGVAVVLVASWLRRTDPWAAACHRGALGLLSLAALITLTLTLLMERALCFGIVLSAALYLRNPEARRPGEGPSGTMAKVAVVGLLTLSLHYIYALMMTRGEGYVLIQYLGRGLRESGTPWLGYWLFGASLLGLGAWALGRPSLKTLGFASIPGVLLAALGGHVEGLLLIPVALVFVAVATPHVLAMHAPLKLPAQLALACLLAVLVLGFTYSSRVLRCPPPDDARMKKLADSGEVFRLALNNSGDLLLSLREERGFSRFVPDAGSSSLLPAQAGPVGGLSGPGDALLIGTPEELVYAAGLDSFFATIVPDDPTPWQSADERGLGESEAVRNLVVRLDGGGTRVEDVFSVPGLCWINTLHWSEEDQLLYLGCEDVPGLHRYDPAGVGLVDSQPASALGDVQDLAFGEGGQAGRLYSISLWRSTLLSELNREDLKVLRQVDIGGMHYHLAYSPELGTLYASSYYGGRIHIVDATTMERTGSLPADFGAREVVVHRGAELLLASSTYSGKLRVWSLRTPEPVEVATLQIGGHIKDVLVDPNKPRAWTWSQCGVYEVNLAGL